MERYSVPVLAEIDTRALVRHLRTHGVMRGVISTDDADPDALVAKARSIRKMDGTDLAQRGLDQGESTSSMRPISATRAGIRLLAECVSSEGRARARNSSCGGL